MKPEFLKYGLLGLLFATSFVFWGFIHSELLFYMEHYQMFLTDFSYFVERVSVVGGLADYIGEFITQFFYYPVLGAAFIAVLYVCFLIVTQKSFKIFGVNENFYPLSFLPVIAVWAFMCNENLLLNFFTAVFISVLTFTLTDRIKPFVIKPVIVIILYYLLGPAAMITPLMYALREFKENKVLVVLTVLILPIEAWLFSRLADYPTESFFVGIDYLRFPFRSYLHLIMLMICPLLPYLLSLYNKEFSQKKSYITSLAVVVSASVIVLNSPSRVATETIKLYELTYNQKWDEIIEFYDKKQTANTYAIQCLNLALAHKGVLNEKMFCYYQPGILGLVSDFQTDMFTSLVSGEVFFRLGAYNLAQRYAFECQENIANFRSSSKLSLRLAETAIINGDYSVARKYIIRLLKTAFYKKQAKKYLDLLASGKKIETSPEFALAFSQKLEKDGAQEELNAGAVFSHLLEKNLHNVLAMQYYHAYSMLTMNYKALANSLELLNINGVPQIPRHIQEALIYYYYNQNKTLKNLPKSISQNVVMAFQRKNIEDSFWKYVVFVNKKTSK
ncbi:MAG: hypothetical protein II956_11635 [Bacteroidales bacterium]|nr:hypothetical protein [Bacteroidales bacterium]